MVPFTAGALPHHVSSCGLWKEVGASKLASQVLGKPPLTFMEDEAGDTL